MGELVNSRTTTGDCLGSGGRDSFFQRRIGLANSSLVVSCHTRQIEDYLKTYENYGCATKIQIAQDSVHCLIGADRFIGRAGRDA